MSSITRPDLLALAFRSLADSDARGFRPIDRMDVDAWSDRHRELSRVANKRGGKWKSRCYQREPQREMTNREVRSVCVVGAAQTFGKSELILNFTGRQTHLNPGPMMIVQPTDGLARRFSRKRLQPMLSDTPVLSEIVAAQKSRNATNTVAAKEIPGGEIRIVGADTPTALCSDPERDVLIDEVDRCQKACGREGDVVTLAEARQEDFGEDAFSLFTSTPSGIRPRFKNGELEKEQPEGVSKILILFAESDQRYWFCPCQKCGKFQTLKWSQVVWPKDKPEQTRYICEVKECLYAHNDAERVAMVESGEWRATAPFSGRRGYFLNGIASLSKPQRGCVNKLHQMVRDFLRATRRGVEALRAWTNTFLCECFAEDASESLDATPLFNRRETFGKKLPEKCCFLVVGGDVHPDRIEIQTIGFGEGEECWPLAYDIIPGDTTRNETWQQVNPIILRAYEHPCGMFIQPQRAAFDTGNSTDYVYDFCGGASPRTPVKRSLMIGVMAVKGIGGRRMIGAPILTRPRKSGVKRIMLYLVSKNTALKTISTWLKNPTPGPGYIHFRDDAGDQFGTEYFSQLTANQVTRRVMAGVELEEFDPGQRRDEAMDTFVYGLAALRRSEVDYVKIMARLLESAKDQFSETKTPKKSRWRKVDGIM